jgi:hypothetical protein
MIAQMRRKGLNRLALHDLAYKEAVVYHEPLRFADLFVIGEVDGILGAVEQISRTLDGREVVSRPPFAFGHLCPTEFAFLHVRHWLQLDGTTVFSFVWRPITGLAAKEQDLQIRTKGHAYCARMASRDMCSNKWLMRFFIK